MKEIDLWLNQILSIWEARFDKLENYITKLQKDRTYGKNRKPADADHRNV